MAKVLSDKQELIRRVLGDDYVDIKLNELNIVDDMEGTCTVSFSLKNGHLSGNSSGSGLVDALWLGVVPHFAREYKSLNTISLDKFTVKTDSSGTAAEVEVLLVVRNSSGTLFDFKARSGSLIAATATATTSVVEFFVNSERSYSTVYRALKNARERNRTDLISRYTAELAELVRSTSYSEVIEGIKKELEG